MSLLRWLLLPATALRRAIRPVLAVLLDVLVLLGLLCAALQRAGVLRRLLLRLTEREISRNANGAPVTVGDLEVDLLRGTARLTDVIVHSPRRDEWRWDSPCVARVGRVDVSISVLSFLDWGIGEALGFPVRDVHWAVVTDVQAFVERRRDVFSFHLLDPALDLPDVQDVMAGWAAAQEAADSSSSATAAALAGDMGAGGGEGGAAPAAPDPGPSPRFAGAASPASPDLARSAGGASGEEEETEKETEETEKEGMGMGSPASERGDGGGGGDNDADEDEEDADGETRANEIVTNVLDAVSSLGRGYNDGGRRGLQTALRTQREGVVTRLREFRARVGDSGGGGRGGGGSGGGGMGGGGRGGEQSPVGSAERAAAGDALSVMRKVGRSIEKRGRGWREQVGDAATFGGYVPRKKEGYVMNDDLFRFGSLVLRDARIFIMTQKNAAALAGEDMSAKAASIDEALARAASGEGGGGGGGGMGGTITAGGWSKPILIEEVVVPGSALCPPSMSRDKETGLPSLGMPMDKVMEVLAKHLLAEMAKTNSGRLLHTAFGEVFSWMDVKRSDSQVTPRSAGAPPTGARSFRDGERAVPEVKSI